MSRVKSNKSQGPLDKLSKRRIERNRATVQEARRRYEDLKTKYGWEGKNYPFILRDGKVRYGYNEFDKVCLEEKVVICEQAHRQRLAFIASGGQSVGSEDAEVA